MDQRGANEPRHERSVFNGIPEPPTAPSELVVCPETSKCDAASEKHPRYGGPWPRPARPRGIKPSADQRRDRKRKRNRETDVTHVKHWRMRDHRGVLEQGIEIAPVRRHWEQTCERIRRQQHEQQESYADDSHHAQHARSHFLRQMTAEQ